ncbi:hypothetical protein LVB87_04110 [Lysobacter sp. KIS68-7]|uniref:hypothetical protein n=1 Tax=Lysobacter sp. KIS68-7 TaxID=2904252 RepID=UPI001E4C7C17|nr:hypothetical protein [Lysobacter sp. KIS68-7]UHQ20354.1 hypothetical protein LVB87_04110 [Lysobacter sp. KIS68-7]
MIRMLRYALLSLLLVSTFAVAGETGKRSDNQDPKPEPGKALIVFVRVSAGGALISSSVYDAPDGETKFIGIVQRGNKVAYQAEPGPHRFMVIAENADFMDATLEAGKTYYALISPRMGVWKARFSLLPIHNDPAADESLQSNDFKKWMGKTSFFEATESNLAWYEANKASVEEKKADYLKKWNVMLPQDKILLTLKAEDGV